MARKGARTAQTEQQAVPAKAEHASVVHPVAFGSTNYHRVRDAIRSDIVTGDFAQGQWLKISAMAERYGLSAAPIREALNQLEGEGLVEMLPNRGARVRTITRDYIADLFEIRLALEPVMAERSAVVATSKDIRLLEEKQRIFEAAVAANITDEIIRANHTFHSTLQNIRPNEPAINLLRQHSALVSAVRRAFGFPPARHRTMVDEHRSLIDACRGNDGQQAFKVMRVHVQHSIEELIPRIPD